MKIIGDKNNKNTITGYRHSGGIIGLTSSDTIIDNCLIENYEIVTDEYGEDVGGIVGKINDNKSTLIVKQQDLGLCNKINDNNSKNSDGTYSGGIVGKWLKILAYMAITFLWIMFSLKIMKIKSRSR